MSQLQHAYYMPTHSISLNLITLKLFVKEPPIQWLPGTFPWGV